MSKYCKHCQYHNDVARAMGRQFDRIEAENKELKEGACRYHCRTAKDNFMDGMRIGNGYRSDTMVQEDRDRECTVRFADK